jgi:hypothetical protein
VVDERPERDGAGCEDDGHPVQVLQEVHNATLSAPAGRFVVVSDSPYTF